jgi:hypothetical protein
MKNIFYFFLGVFFLVAGNANAAFIGEYHIDNWTQTVNGGSIITGSAPDSVALISSNNGGGEKNQDFTIQVLANGIANFHWAYHSDDDDALYDPFGWLLNGTFSVLTHDGKDSVNQSGNVSIPVSAGDIFGFRMNSDDSMNGAATATVSGFSAPVPLPAAVWLFGTGLFGVLWQIKRKQGVTKS